MSRPAPTWQGQHTAPTRFVLLRHGQTELSVHRRYSGRGNPELTASGREQARRAADALTELPITAVLTSPLARAAATAQAVADRLQLPVVVEEGFIETDFGAWEGLTFSEAAQQDPQLHRQWLGDAAIAAPGGESFDEVAHRVAAARGRVIAAHAGETVVVVSHVTPIKSMLQQALRVGPQLLFHLHLDLASVSHAEFYPDGGSVVRAVNDVSHLRGGPAAGML